MIEAFLNSVAVVDTEATTANPLTAELIEIGVARYKFGSWEVNDSLFKPDIAIPVECSAVCNVTDAMVVDKPTMLESVDYIFNLLDPINTKYYVAHHAPYDMDVLSANFKRIGVDFNVERDLSKNSWICTRRLAQKVLADKEGIQFNQSFLRYYFKLNLDPSLYPHRAGNDAIVCAHILVKLMEEAIVQGLIDLDLDIGKQLSELSWAALKIDKWPFGKHKGKKLSELDDGFLKWAVLNVDLLNATSPNYNSDLAKAVEAEINTRPSFKM